MTDVPDSEKHLFIVSYDDDSERKRVEYLFKNWDEGEVEHPDGLVRVTSGVDHDELYEQLVTKVPADQIESYRLSSVDTELEPESITVERTIQAPQAPVESFLNYVLSKRKAVLQSADRNEYEVYSKKGRADVRYSLSGGDEETTVRVRIDGYPPAPSFLSDFFREELDEFSASQQ